MERKIRTLKGKTGLVIPGTIEDIHDDNLAEILWDESTLERFDAKFTKKCDRKNLDYRRRVLRIDEIEMIGSN
ncbi:MAG: hypothetical protein O7C75_18075 [Verrucomicrobia bacterium]|nr:hypothetical protein [Verrucomicrobiota bacterium]